VLLDLGSARTWAPGYPYRFVPLLTSLESHATMVAKRREEKASWFAPNHRG